MSNGFGRPTRDHTNPHDLAHGAAELLRIALRRAVILTWDQNVFKTFWFLKDYLPVACDTDRVLRVPIQELIALLPEPAVETIAVPHDCADGFGGSWCRPRAYLDPTVRAGMSMLALTPETRLDEGVLRLRRDSTPVGGCGNTKTS